MKELRIGLKEVEQLYTQLSEEDSLDIPDYAVFNKKTKQLTQYISVPDYIYLGGNIPEGHPKLRWHTTNADGEYLGAFDVIELIADDNGMVSGLTTIEEYLHYRNKHKNIEMTHYAVKMEAEDLCKKIGLCI